MREQEQELIAALAEGSLDDETEARALLDASAEARAEYRLQLEALDALRTARSVQLTEVERARLRRDTWTELRSSEAKSRSTAAIYGWSLAAAALFVVVGLAAVLGNGFGAQDAATFDESSSGLESPAADMATEESTEEAQGGVTFGEAEGDDGGTALIPPSSRDYFEAEATRLRDADREETLRAAGDDDAVCLEQARLFDHEVIAALEPDDAAPVDGSYLVAAPSGEELGEETPIHFVDADLCELAYTAR